MAFELILGRIKQRIFKILIFLTSKFPKQNNLVLFGAWFGQKYSDNSMYLYEYLLNDFTLSKFWITKNPAVFQKLRYENKPVLMANSFRSIYYHLRAKIMIASVDKDDFNKYFIGGTTFINLGHGIPLKKVGFDRNAKEYNDSMIFYSKYNTDIFISTSTIISEIYQTAWPFAKTIVSLGQPRNDLFYNGFIYSPTDFSKICNKGDKKVIVYMPTHRAEGRETIKANEKLDLNTIQNICIENNCFFIIKKHYYHKDESDDISLFDRIIDITKLEIDTQTLLFETDILITDYSSCFFDFLLLDRPIIYYWYDKDQYDQERGVYFDYNDIAAGAICYNKDELNNSLILHLESIDIYNEKRKIVKDMFFDEKNQGPVCSQISNYIKGVFHSK